ncbi:START domain-containing protein [Runella sp.]|jgi:hypothetical protein|uniref:START domain-containing protein n=1 Tax=Runella sp. TaxID=1960881 RepID=UPI00260FAF01|nr:START domain-containing protein [Runella sp.]
MPKSWKSVCFFPFTFILLSSLIVLGQQPQSGNQHDTWKLEKDKNGIRVYSRHLEDSKFKEVKVNCDLNATLSQLAAFVSDIDHYKDAVYRVADAYVVKRVNDREFYFYNETAMSWPVSNRDLVMHMVFQMDHTTRTLHIRGTNVPGMMPEKKGVVRIPHWHSLWTIHEIANNKLRVEYLFSVDPGGELPIWLVNTLIAVGPYQSFSGMEKLLSRPYYQNRTFSFLQP